MEQIPQKHFFTGLAKCIVTNNLLNEGQVADALEKSQHNNIPLVNYLIENKLVDSRQLALVASNGFGLPFLNLNEFNLDFIPNDIVREDILKKNSVLPLYKRGTKLFVAVADPMNQIVLDDIKFSTGLNVNAILVQADLLTKSIEKIQASRSDTVLNEINDTDLDSLDISSDQKLIEMGGISVEANDAPIIRFVHKILLDAINQGASDIHFEPYEKKYRVRFRHDGILTETASPPITLAGRISARIKVMARLDISERRIPQDGRFKINVSANRAIDFRVSSCPTVGGEKIVVRILDPGNAKIGVEALGFEPFQKEIFLKILHHPQGMILVTGPTGSGKTVTLYTALNILNTDSINISTVEDPVEIHVSGINQVNINLKAGLTFATVLRAFLRQDPDVIMVGEIRDLETAEISVKAAQTGHLMLSTLHTNSAPETLTRLANMGLPAFNIATSVSLIIAQRLARKLCQQCKKHEEIPIEALLKEGFSEEVAKNMKVYAPNPDGCDLCNKGYKGRVGIFEVLEITEQISNSILAGNNSLELLKLAQQQGMITLRQSGLLKVQQGITSLTEINRITKD